MKQTSNVERRTLNVERLRLVLLLALALVLGTGCSYRISEANAGYRHTDQSAHIGVKFAPAYDGKTLLGNSSASASRSTSARK